MQPFNIINGLEASEYSWSKTAPRKMTGSPSGETETLNFTGSTQALKALAQQYLAQGSAAMQVSCTVTRQEADMARLAVVRTYYGSSDTPDTPPENPAGDVGSSESNPCVSFDFTEVQQPILTHPKVQSMGLHEVSPQWIALRMLSQGADLMQTFTWGSSGQEPVVFTVAEGLQGVPSDVQTLVGGQQFYLDVMITASVKYEIPADAERPDFGELPRIEEPPNALRLTGGRNWLFCGGGIALEGDRVIVTKNYKASEPGGWNPEIYS